MNKMIASAAVLTLACSGAAIADEDKSPNPYAKADDSWITLKGTVESVSADSFILDYGEGIVTVEMDDGDRDADGYKLLRGDEVTVTGAIDDDFFEATTIEASSVYVQKLNTHFYASAIDEEDAYVTYYYPVVVSSAHLVGTVSEVGDEEFTLDTGVREVTVEVDALPYNPLDNEGYQQIEVGDRVSVTGRVDDDLFEGREVVADSVVTLAGS